METGFRLEVPWGDIKDVSRKLLSLRQVASREVWTLAAWGLEQLKARTPRSNRPGGVHLQDRWVRERTMSGGGVVQEIILRNTAPHASVLRFLEGGTSPHIIKGNPILVFKIDGKTIFTRRVRHPGTRPYKILELAKKALLQKAVAMNRMILTAYTKYVGRK